MDGELDRAAVVQEPTHARELRAGRARERLARSGSFVRFSALGATLVLPLLGLATSSRPLGPARLAIVLTLACSFHVFAFVLNDVVDVEIDRTEPRRARSPLVRGTISRKGALAIALAQVPISFWLAGRLEAGLAADVSLGAAFLGLGIYDVWGKRTSVPVVTDVVQGLGWGSLLLVGAAVGGTLANAATWATFAFVVVFITMANGVHGALRDLRNDAAAGIRSTAIVFGATIDPELDVFDLPDRYARYAKALHLVLLVLAGVIVVTEPATAWQRTLAALGVAIFAIVCARLFRATLRAARGEGDYRAAGFLHLGATLALPIVALAPVMDGVVLVAVTIGYLAPVAAHAWFPIAVRWARERIVGTTTWHRIVGWLRLTRLENAGAAGLATLVGARLAERSADMPWGAVLRTALVACCVVVAANTVNDMRDREADSVNKPHRPLPAGRVSLGVARWTALVASILALLVAATLGWPRAWWAFGLLALSLLYSIRLKSTVLLGNVVVAALAASTVPFGSAGAGSISPESWFAAAALFLFVLSSEVLKAVEDREGDAAAGYSTVATKLSPRHGLLVYELLAAAFVVVALLPLPSRSAPMAFAAMIVPAAVLPTILVMGFVWSVGDRRSITLSVAATKAVWFTGLGALCLLR